MHEFPLISNWLTENNQIRLKYNYYLKHKLIQAHQIECYQVKNFILKLDKHEISLDDTNNENQLYDFGNVQYILSQM